MTDCAVWFYNMALILVKINILLAFLLAGQIEGQRWMKMALAANTIYTKQICNNYHFTTKTQRQICLKYSDVTPKITEGAEMAYSECRHQYRWRRWNCSVFLNPLPKESRSENLTNRILFWMYKENYPTLFGDVFQADGKEGAFVNAIFSAGVAYAVTKACSSNEQESCSCDRSNTVYHQNDFHWHQCSDNVRFGINIAKKFVDSVELSPSVNRIHATHSHKLMNLHNNEVGRKLLENTQQRKCVCHGVSGSCNTKVCTRELAPFRYVGSLLRKRSDQSIKVTLKYINTHRVLMPVENLEAPLTNNDLVYLRDSPSYCNLTSGRRCKNKKKSDRGSCDVMCCGKGYRTKMRNITRNCNCTFIWCCKVTCEKCKYRQKMYTCK